MTRSARSLLRYVKGSLNGLLLHKAFDFALVHRLLDLLFIGVTIASLNYSYPSHDLLAACTLGAFVNYYSFSRLRLYSSQRLSPLTKVFLRFNVAFVPLAVLLGYYSSLINSNYYLNRLAIVYLCFLFNHIFLRFVFRLLRRSGGNKRVAVSWGSPENISLLQSTISNSPWLGIKLEKWFFLSSSQSDMDLSYSGGLPDMKKYLNTNTPDIVIVFPSLTDSSTTSLLEILGDTPIPVILCPPWQGLNLSLQRSDISTLPAYSLWGIPEHSSSLYIKRVSDFIVALTLLVLLAPLLLLIYLLILFSSSGHPIFKQERYGLSNRPFVIYKFRTMHLQPDDAKIVQATSGDSRVTPLGSFLRRTSLDELPQLINVLNGTMSIVGPRPHAVEHNTYYRTRILGYSQRHMVKPGITGLSQVRGLRGNTEDCQLMVQRVASDLEYQRKWSLSLDIKILFKTLIHLLKSDAY